MPYRYYGPMAAIFGHHHYLYGYSFEKFDSMRPEVAAKEAMDFYRSLRRVH
jgi:hypothetical protein